MLKIQQHIETERPVLITGGQGSGKTLLAREIAQAHGRYALIDASELTAPLAFSYYTADIETIVVEEIDFSSTEQRRAVDELVDSGELTLRQKGKPDTTIPKPNFIFVSGNIAPPNLKAEDRRFFVIPL